MDGLTEPRPAGDPLTAYRRVLARAKRAEAELRALKTERATTHQQEN